MKDTFLIKKIIFLAASMSLSACLQIFQPLFIYWRYSFFSEPWRCWTGHWVHVGWIHFVLNMLAFLCLPFIFPLVKVRHLVAILLILPPIMSICFYYFYPHVEAYAGLSGVLHGLYIACAIFYLQFQAERKFAVFVLFLVCAKIVWENTFGSLKTAELIGSPVLVEAHLLGAMLGAILAGLYLGYRFWKKRLNPIK